MRKDREGMTLKYMTEEERQELEDASQLQILGGENDWVAITVKKIGELYPHRAYRPAPEPEKPKEPEIIFPAGMTFHKIDWSTGIGMVVLESGTYTMPTCTATEGFTGFGYLVKYRARVIGSPVGHYRRSADMFCCERHEDCVTLTPTWVTFVKKVDACTSR